MGKMYKIRELVFQKCSAISTLYVSNTIHGEYMCRDDGKDSYWGYFPFSGVSKDKIERRSADSLESAKLACQSHYEERIKQSLVECDVLDRVKAECENSIKDYRDSSDDVRYALAATHELAQTLLTIINDQQGDGTFTHWMPLPSHINDTQK